MAFNLPPGYIETIRDSPAATPPPGVIPNYDSPPNGNWLATITIFASIAITTFAFLIRSYSKVFCTKKVKLEDYLGLLSFPFFIAGTTVLITIPRGPGFFVHQWNLHVKDLEKFLYAYVLSTTLYCVTLALAKAAILLECTHIFVVKSNRSLFYWICYVLIAVNTALYLVTIVGTAYACSPRERIWRRYLPGTCIDLSAFNISITTFHLISDILMLLLPQKIIWNLRLATKQKIGVSVVFSGGAIACIWAAGRVASAIHLSASRDSTYAYSQYIMWGLAEVATAQLVFCVPAFPVIFRQAPWLRRFYCFVLSKTTATSSPERLQSNNTVSQMPHGTDSQPVVPSSRFTTVENSYDGRVTDLEMSRQAFDQHRHSSELHERRIRITTEINITTQERLGYGGDVKPTSNQVLWQG
ncbi:hypothetical protein F5Y03DRAFT_406259 [Xylaria venustula]|nr:hypothetical protein F5Y03DRAFT_406259 [Xylaria venustula]